MFGDSTMVRAPRTALGDVANRANGGNYIHPCDISTISEIGLETDPLSPQQSKLISGPVQKWNGKSGYTVTIRRNGELSCLRVCRDILLHESVVLATHFAWELTHASVCMSVEATKWNILAATSRGCARGQRAPLQTPKHK